LDEIITMKKAVITTGSKQYLVAVGDEIKVELIKDVGNTVSFDALLVMEDGKVSIGMPLVDKASVSADVVEADAQADKVTSIRYKAKKRVHKTRGHRQHLTTLKIKKIA
jgi:large subunit ribosomal protein L21